MGRQVILTLLLKRKWGANSVEERAPGVKKGCLESAGTLTSRARRKLDDQRKCLRSCSKMDFGPSKTGVCVWGGS